MASQDSEIPVLIVGAGVAGLTASLFLSHHGISSIIFERRSGTSIHPRARSVNARTMELFRHLRIDERVKEAGASLSASKGIYQGATLKDVIESKPRVEEKREFPLAKYVEGIGPVRGTFVTQDHLEPVLVDAVRERSGEIRWNTELTSFSQDSSSVTATVKHLTDGATSTLRAQYLIAADGAKSPIRTQLNVPTLGAGTLGHLLNILFTADLEALVKNREFSLCLIKRPEVTGLFTSINNSDRWVFHLSYDPTKGETPEDFPPERCIELLKIALGIPEIDINIISVLPWEPSVRVVEKMQHGRIFLAGDAAHQMPPYGGQGANSGIVDAHNLAWKIAAVINGQAPDALLETYDEERFPAGLEAAEASGAGVDDRGLLSLKKDWTVIKGWARKLPLLSGHGYGYTSKAIGEEYTGPLRGWTWTPWTLPALGLGLDGRPGRRVPHVWIEKAGQRISTLDLCGKGFVLLAGADGEAWEDAAKQVGNAVGVEIISHCINSKGEVVAEEGAFEVAAGISSGGALLVRPDDFVAWRARKRLGNGQEQLEQAMRQVLCLE
ncbi:FAD-binding monooxygenase-like protein [Lophiotrema nucula]|uniref:FAD-binding monooxygenase-like protein n=1 Tax=Lophiotrema nucula TaxID=690887 RepID=A0A6A5ZQC9_9PLEO|nr:FAD-binding monooxygenase-like protein [Lophiotrema nucula]